MDKRKKNELAYEEWEDFPSGGRRYSIKVIGKQGWSAVYFKEVNDAEITIRFWQEIYNEQGILVEIHEKYPADKGHRPFKG